MHILAQLLSVKIIWNLSVQRTYSSFGSRPTTVGFLNSIIFSISLSKIGKKADLVIADIDRKWIVEPEKLHSKSHNTVFKGMTLTGKPLVTISKGRICYDAR